MNCGCVVKGNPFDGNEQIVEACVLHLTWVSRRIQQEVTATNLRNEEWEKLVRAAADQIYALGKQLRAIDLASGQTLQVLSTEMHRECQVIKGESPLPHAGERLTEKMAEAPQICMAQTGCMGGTCGKLLPCDDHPPAGNPWAPNQDYPGKPAKKPKCPYNHSDHQVAGFLPVQNCPNCA